jgi:hypothetical protein
VRIFTSGLAALALAVLAAAWGPACGGAPASISGALDGATSSGSSGSGSGGPSSSGGHGSSGLDAASGLDAPGADDVVIADDTGLDGTASEAAVASVTCPGAFSMTTMCMQSEVCCVTSLLGAQSGSCTAKNACMGTAVQCSGASSCPGQQVCCGVESIGITTMYTQVSCAASCTGANHYQFCTAGDSCPQGTTCRASTILTGFTVCR